MDFVKGIIPICLGVAIGMATVWLTMPGVVADGSANDLQSFVPNLTARQLGAVAQAIQEQWEVMASLRQQASDQSLLPAPGDLFRQAREITDEQLSAVLGSPQPEAFRHWRATRFGAPGGMSR